MQVVQGAFLLAFATLTVWGGNHFRSDYNYHSTAQGWFKYHTVPAKWEDARVRCTLEGAVLASPINTDISDVMHSIISKAGHSCTSGVYTGVHNTITPTDYASLEGVPLSELAVGKGDIFSKEYSATPSCMRLLRDGLVVGSCTDSLPYLCYKRKTADLQVTECGTDDTSYRFDNRTGHCYKFHTYTLRWSLAYLTCAAEGGYLAVINSAAEATLLTEIYNKYSAATILGPSNRGLIHVGFYDWKESGIWRTIHGESLEKAGFAEWNTTQPANAQSHGQGQHCGAMFRSGLLDDISCDNPFPFICEKDPKTLRPVPHQCAAK